MNKFLSFTLIFIFSLAITSFFIIPAQANDFPGLESNNALLIADNGDGGEGDGGDGDDGSGNGGNGDEGGPVTLDNPIGTDKITGVINNIIIGLRDTIAPPLVAIAVLYGGFLMLFASGDPEKFQKGKKAILYAMVGYAIILIAGGITSLIYDIIGA